MGAEMIGAIFTGVIGLATVVTGFLLKRTETVADNVDDLRLRLNVAIAHIYELRGVMTGNGLSLPELPDELSPRRTRRNGTGRDRHNNGDGIRGVV